MSENNKPKKQINWDVVFVVGSVTLVGASMALSAYVTHSKVKTNKLYHERTATAYEAYLKSMSDSIIDGTVKIYQETSK